MPTTRARHTLTETPELARALDAAGEVWPELRDDRGALLRKLVEAGHESVVHMAAERVAARRLAIRRAAGAVTGSYPQDAAEQLKAEWPE